MYSHPYTQQPLRPSSSMSYGPVIPFDPRLGTEMMRRSKSSQGFVPWSSSTWPRSHDMQSSAAANRPPLQQLANNSWSNPYKSHQSQPRYPYPQQPPSAYRYPVYSHTKDMYHNFQLNPPPPLANFRDPNALSATWIGPDGQHKNWDTVEREEQEELMRRKSTRSSSSSRRQPPLTALGAGYPTGFDPQIHQPAVHAPGGPGGFVHPQQGNAYANHVHPGPSHNQVVGRQSAQETDDLGPTRPPPIVNDFGSWPGKVESTLRWDLTDPLKVVYHNGRTFRTSHLQLALFTEPLTRIRLYIEPATRDYSLRPYEFTLSSIDNKPFTIGMFIQVLANFLNSKIPANLWQVLPKAERHEIIKAWWRRTKTEAPMTWTENNDALIVRGFTGFPMMDLLGQYVIFNGLAKPKGYQEPTKWMLKTSPRPLK